MSDRKVALPDFASEAAEIRDELVSLRRAIHLEPEIGLDNPQTQAKILDALEGLPLEITLGRGLSSVTAVLRGGKPGPTVLLRGDTDGLPMHEQTGLFLPLRGTPCMRADMTCTPQDWLVLQNCSAPTRMICPEMLYSCSNRVKRVKAGLRSCLTRVFLTHRANVP